MLAQSDFENSFTDWLTTGAITSVGWVVVVLLVSAIVLMAVRSTSS
ncbi:MAG: hypothetical protein HKN03_07285 [Acidimicrobiales bacterium]|nr:hypothetical protein [Acidimicrobiales bacterium]